VQGERVGAEGTEARVEDAVLDHLFYRPSQAEGGGGLQDGAPGQEVGGREGLPELAAQGRVAEEVDGLQVAGVVFLNSAGNLQRVQAHGMPPDWEQVAGRREQGAGRREQGHSQGWDGGEVRNCSGFPCRRGGVLMANPGPMPPWTARSCSSVTN
jgi:hypothetical protein